MKHISRGTRDWLIFMAIYAFVWWLFGWWPWAMFVFAAFVGYNIGNVTGYSRGLNDGADIVYRVQAQAEERLGERRRAAPFN